MTEITNKHTVATVVGIADGFRHDDGVMDTTLSVDSKMAVDIIKQLLLQKQNIC